MNILILISGTLYFPFRDSQRKGGEVRNKKLSVGVK